MMGLTKAGSSTSKMLEPNKVIHILDISNSVSDYILGLEINPSKFKLFEIIQSIIIMELD